MDASVSWTVKTRRGLPRHLKGLEAESIEIMREVIAESKKPVMLYSIGKDSSVMLHLAIKAFHPAKLPFPLLHIDTTWKFREMIAFRDETVRRLGRDEEKSRAKERIFSFRSQGHVWDPRNQRPELWDLFNTRVRPGETIRVFPLSNWTERDIWHYIMLEDIPVVPLYFAKQRPVVRRDGAWIMVDDDRLPLEPRERVEMRLVRFRTLGCYPLTGAIESDAVTLEDVVSEMRSTRVSERQGRLIDSDEAASMEKKKREGYF